MNNLISVIIPVYNIKEYLERCVNSIISQTFKNLEIILVDDGSTDGSDELCDKMAIKDSRIVVYHKKNGGLSDARNYGIERAKGKYISFVDSDDWIASNMLEDLYNAILKYDVKLAICETTFAYNNYNYSPTVSGDTFLLDKIPAYKLLLKNRRFRTNAWNKLYLAELWSDLRFPKGRKYEDVFIMHKIYDMCEKIAYVDKALYYYFQRSNSIVHIPDISADYDLLEGTIERYEYLKKYSELEILSNAAVVSSALTLYRNCGLHHTQLSKSDYARLNSEIDSHMKYVKNKDLSPRLRLEYLLYYISPKILILIEPLLEKIYLKIRRN